MDQKKRTRICVEVDEETTAIMQKQIEILKKERAGCKVTVSDVVRHAIHQLDKNNRKG